MSEAERALARALRDVPEASHQRVGPQGWRHISRDGLPAAILAVLSADGWRVEKEGLDVERLYRAMCIADNDQPGVFNIVAVSEPDTRPVAEYLAAIYAALRGGPDATD